MSEAAPPHALAVRYDALWDAAAPAVRQGRVAFDARAPREADDARRGVTLLARPAPAVAARLAALFAELRPLARRTRYSPEAWVAD